MNEIDKNKIQEKLRSAIYSKGSFDKGKEALIGVLQESIERAERQTNNPEKWAGIKAKRQAEIEYINKLQPAKK
jgi:hypothetical protein